MAKRLRDVCALPENEPLWRAGRGFVVRDLPWTEEKTREICQPIGTNRAIGHAPDTGLQARFIAKPRISGFSHHFSYKQTRFHYKQSAFAYKQAGFDYDQ
jgi:hypothetical protein